METASRATWVDFETVSILKEYESTRERRVVQILRETPIRVCPAGFRFSPLPPLFRDFDRLAHVFMGPRRLSFDLSGMRLTTDRIAFQGACALEVSVRDSEDAIRTIALSSNEQESLILDRARDFLQTMTTEYARDGLLRDRERIAAAILARFKSDQSSDSAFQVSAVRLLTPEPIDELIQNEQGDSIRADIQATLERKDDERRAEQAQRRRMQEFAEAAARREIAARDFDDELQRKTRHSDFEVEELGKRAKILATEAGQMAVDLNRALEHRERMEQLKLDIEAARTRQDREILTDILNAVLSHEAGANEVLLKVLDRFQQHTGQVTIDIKKPSPRAD